MLHLMRSGCRATLIVTLAIAGLVACGGDGFDDDPILRLSAEEALAEGTRLMAEKKYRMARRYLVHAFEVEPNSRSGREGLLLAADALFLQGGFDNFVEAEQRYRDFLNRFPTSDQAAYAQFRIAESLSRRMEKPDRDQTITRKAIEEFEAVLRLYPTTEYALQARGSLEVVRNRLAEHEYAVAFFYFRYGAMGAAAERLKTIFEQYPDYDSPDKALALMCRVYARTLERLRQRAVLTEGTFTDLRDGCTRLRTEFGSSKHIGKAPSAAKIAQLEKEKLTDAPAEAAESGSSEEGSADAGDSDVDGDGVGGAFGVRLE